MPTVNVVNGGSRRVIIGPPGRYEQKNGKFVLRADASKPRELIKLDTPDDDKNDEKRRWGRSKPISAEQAKNPVFKAMADRLSLDLQPQK